MLLSNIDDDCHIVFRLRSGVCAAADTRSHRFTLNPHLPVWDRNLCTVWNKIEHESKYNILVFGIESSISSAVYVDLYCLRAALSEKEWL